jgi:SHAQKYF class myb-like DNA-binding protein
MNCTQVFAIHKTQAVFKVEKVQTLESKGKSMDKKVFEITYGEVAEQGVVGGEVSLTARRAVKSGTWTPEEHKRFLDALQRYGNSWKKIQTYVGSRSCVQVRSHCQKYFDSMRLKAIRKVKKSKEHKLFTVYRTYRNTTYDFTAKNKIDLEGAIQSPRIEAQETSNKPNIVDSNELGSEDVGGFMDLYDSANKLDVYISQDFHSGVYEEYLPEPFNDDSYAQNLLIGNKFDELLLINDEMDAFGIGAKRKISWHDDEHELFVPMTRAKVQYDA